MKHLPNLKNVTLAAAAVAVALCASTANAQWYKLNHGSLSAGGTGQFSTILTSNATPGNGTSSNGVAVTGINQRQDTTWSAGVVGSLQIHPVSWAGVQINYGFTHYQERFSFNYAAAPSVAQQVRIPVDYHEATAGYLVHPKHIPFQPYMVIGGGAIYFSPYGNGTNHQLVTNAPAQWRGTGLLETGFDIPTSSKHVGFRISGRTLVYRSPNFNSSVISTRSWRATSEPMASVYYKF